jgi:hypothetical protein
MASTTGVETSPKRFTWEAVEDGGLNWRNEMAIGEGEGFLIEQYPMVPVQPHED